MPPDPPSLSPPPPSDDRLRGLRRKLLRLNRAPLQEGGPRPEERGAKDAANAECPPPEPLPAGGIIYRRDLPRVPRPRVPEGGGICIPLEQLVAGREVPGRNGSLYLIEHPVAETTPEGTGFAQELAHAVEALTQRVDCGLRIADCGLKTEAGESRPHVPSALNPSQPTDPDPARVVCSPQSEIRNPQSAMPGLCFLDIETTGLGSSPVFLIGTLVWRDGGLVCRQFLARTYAEEAAILGHYVDQARLAPFLISFNGRTFDLPYLRVRAAATGVPFAEPSGHLDLLHVARRLFRGTLPDCKLQTLERYVCRRTRGADIPGADIRAAYHDFVRTGDAREIALVVRHNQHDLVTMAHLITRLAIQNPQSEIRTP